MKTNRGDYKRWSRNRIGKFPTKSPFCHTLDDANQRARRASDSSRTPDGGSGEASPSVPVVEAHGALSPLGIHQWTILAMFAA